MACFSQFDLAGSGSGDTASLAGTSWVKLGQISVPGTIQRLLGCLAFTDSHIKRAFTSDGGCYVGATLDVNQNDIVDGADIEGDLEITANEIGKHYFFF